MQQGAVFQNVVESGALAWSRVLRHWHLTYEESSRGVVDGTFLRISFDRLGCVVASSRLGPCGSFTCDDGIKLLPVYLAIQPTKATCWANSEMHSTSCH